MIDLYLDSSNNDMSVGIAKEDILLDETSYEAWQRQSEVMIPELDKLLNKHNLNKDDISSVVVCIGPGSYTGVRIAITIAKTINAVLNVPIYPISSLHALKDDDKPSICLINARSKRSYIGVYQNEKCLLKDQIMSNDDVLTYIKNHPDYSICGDVTYLGINGIKSDLVKQMISIKKHAKPHPNPLALTPIYMKD